MSVLAIIPARSGSKRLKNKNFRDFAMGDLVRPLWAHAVEQALRIKEIDRVVAVVDSESYNPPAHSTLHGHGLTKAGLLVRPDHLAKDETPMAHLIAWVLGQQKEWPSLVVLLQPTSPTRTDETVRLCIKNAKREGTSMTIADPGQDALIRGDWKGPKPNGACYVFPPHRLPPLSNSPFKDVMTDDIDVDTLKDFEKAEAVMRERLK